MSTFRNRLLDYLNFSIKNDSIDEELADEILNEWDKPHQEEWLNEMEAKADAQAEAWLERQNEESERRDNSE